MKPKPHSGRSVKEPKLSRAYAPPDLSPAGRQRALRRQFGREQVFVLENKGVETAHLRAAEHAHVVQ